MLKRYSKLCYKSCSLNAKNNLHDLIIEYNNLHAIYKSSDLYNSSKLNFRDSNSDLISFVKNEEFHLDDNFKSNNSLWNKLSIDFLLGNLYFLFV